MANDPFPNTTDMNTEQRFNVLFQASSTILVLPMDPIEKKNGLTWVNTTTKQLKVYSGGMTWIIGNVSVES